MAAESDRSMFPSAVPIPTMHNGVVYRSRLEARWAVFFDALEIRALYEQEAFEFEDGSRYLPDFWLPDVGVFVEVKPTAPTRDELRKCERLTAGTGRRLVIVIGAPCTNFMGSEYGVMFFSDGTSDEPYIPCECPVCRKIEWHYEGRADRVRCECTKPPGTGRQDSERIIAAAKLANAVNLGVR